MNRYQNLINQARDAFKKQEYATAIGYYEDAFEEKIILEDLIDLGLVCLTNSNPLKAHNVFLEAVELFPNSPLGYYGVGMVNEELGKLDEALKYYEEAIKQDHTFSEAYFSIALILEDQNDDKKAYDYYKKTVLYNPDHFWGNLNLGAFYEKNGYIDLAIEHTLKAYEINPNEKMVAYNLGDAREDFLKRVPVQRFGRPEDIAPFVSFLCTEGAGYLTGQTVRIDGGFVG
jgi:tetratricopeptide (TPR) repeat protein